MSYILDALRKADSDRERDPARGIHAQPRSPVAAGAASHLPGWVWPATAIGVVIAAAVLWWPRQAPVALPDPPTMAVPSPIPAPAPAAATLPSSTTVADSVSPPAPPPLPAAPVVRAPADGPPNMPRSSGRTAPPPALAGVPAGIGVPSAPVAPGGASARAAAPSAQAAPHGVVPTSERVFAPGELPPEVQRDLPKLAISGGTHSENPAQRMLIVGGQVVNEGTEVAPGVVLEQIRAHAAVLRFRGYRYSVAF
jgi:general secretion pathway protein B